MARYRIVGWKKINARKDVKSPTWFKLKHGLFEDPEFYDFSHAELLAWIYMLCLASKKSSDEIEINFSHAERIGRLKRKEIESAILKLVPNQLVPVDVTYTLHGRDADVTDAGARLEENRLEEIREENTIAHSRCDFDFESLYKKYPRKLGKARGLQLCKSQIKSEADYQALSIAIDRYRGYIQAQSTEEKFIKHFSTFMSSWRDWLDPATGTADAVSQPKRRGIEELLAEEEAKKRAG